VLCQPNTKSQAMSLRGFHIVFLVLASLSDLFVWNWTRTNPLSVEHLHLEWLRVASGWLAVLLMGYTLWFVLKKARTIIVG
jgi:hypothetical protein